jgi:threonine/homoserine/homoserine lactone efflux protein
VLNVAPDVLALYIGVMAAMAVTPGPANVFAIATGVERGWRAALTAVLGMNAATFVWFVGAAIGLAALVAAFPLAFRVLAIGGALYVGWLGVQALWAGFRGDGYSGKRGRTAPGSAFVAGFSVQISNPKAVLFFTAVLPPFIDPASPSGPQLATFATVTFALDAAAMSAYGVGGAALSRAFAVPRFRRGFSILVSLLLLGAAALIVLR